MERLNIVFWQNINSMHQSAFLKALAQHHDVTLVTIRRGSGREDMGWSEPSLPNVTLLHIDEIDWKLLIRKNAGRNAIHVFAGLHAFRPVHRALLYACRHDCRIGVYAEPLVIQGGLGLIKQWRGMLDAMRFSDRLEFVLCIGKECRRQYLGWGFPEHKLHDWAYVTEALDIPTPQHSAYRPFRIIFPASCSSRKGADLLLEAASSLKTDLPFELICHSLSKDPPNKFERRMIDHIRGKKHIHLLPFIENDKVRIAISEADLLVLPSRFDGWGAVVNEALGVGTPVLVSDRCGSSILVQDKPLLGAVFGPPELTTLQDSLMRIINMGAPSLERREQIRSWSESCISGPTLANHFMTILERTTAHSQHRTTPPWERSAKSIETAS
jgi:glycosyltransferase involved in cell wall biosynthesis